MRDNGRAGALHTRRRDNNDEKKQIRTWNRVSSWKIFAPHAHQLNINQPQTHQRTRTPYHHHLKQVPQAHRLSLSDWLKRFDRVSLLLSHTIPVPARFDDRDGFGGRAGAEDFSVLSSFVSSALSFSQQLLHLAAHSSPLPLPLRPRSTSSPFCCPASRSRRSLSLCTLLLRRARLLS